MIEEEHIPPLKLDCFTWEHEEDGVASEDTLAVTDAVEATVEKPLLDWEAGEEPTNKPDSEPISLQEQPPKEEELLPPAHAGRPRKKLDLELIEKFASVGMPVLQIAKFFNTTPQTLYNRVGDLLMACRTKYEYDIWMQQKVLADAGDRQMLIHLGKTMLRQSEALPTEVDDAGGNPEWVVTVPKAPKPTALTQSERDELEGDEE